MVGLALLALALAMDAFAAALTEGAAARSKPTTAMALRVGLAFGGAQALMPLLGWSLGLAFESVIRDVDHWIAFVLLAVLGARMVRAGFHAEDRPGSARLSAPWALAGAALATSIDAAAAGITIPLLGQPIAAACAVIGGITFLLSSAGVLLGGVCGVLLGRRAETAGGLVLIGLGCKILIEHTFLGGG
jgi:putative Mn2+ efflux pump MntP